MKSLKKKLNLTIDEHVVDKAKRLVESRGESLSALVEDFLARLVHDVEALDNQGDANTDDWLAAFHQTQFPKNYQEPSDEQLTKFLDER